jgi:hypothetical protein
MDTVFALYLLGCVYSVLSLPFIYVDRDFSLSASQKAVGVFSIVNISVLFLYCL